MNHRFGWAMLVAVGVLVGFASQFVSAGRRRAASGRGGRDRDWPTAENPHDADVLSELKEIRTQLKEINTQLHTGSIKMIVLINPDAK